MGKLLPGCSMVSWGNQIAIAWCGLGIPGSGCGGALWRGVTRKLLQPISEAE
jgi:hypothetical protein